MTRLHLARSRPPSPSAADVPRGHLAVYVGEGRKRLVIPTACLSHPAFVTLLKRVEDEFGFDHRCGGLTIPIPLRVGRRLRRHRQRRRGRPPPPSPMSDE
ncbi:unnamed protein product [Miscanthus lutarioriparius]|uniref:Uncharacterized protein n=1 Tax=Miscanthus lutarioriparius TaxID=422564 RepID=A0A811R8H8_9POAL|nr:unnamed protein product [Miscanthus lutarioriparius]